MNTMKERKPVQFYNKEAVRKEMIKRGYDISYSAVVKYEKDGLLKPIGFYPNGTLNIPVFDDKSITDLITALQNRNTVPPMLK